MVLSSDDDDAIIDQICSRYEEVARTGKFPDLADLLELAPKSRQDELLEHLICLDYEYRRQAGQAVSEGQYRNQFPEKSAIIDLAFRLVRDRSTTLAAGPEQRREPEAASIQNQQPRKEGSRAGKYQLERFLGRGAFSDVHLGRNDQTQRVAIKILHERIPDDSGIRDGFTQEAETLKQIQHPAIVPLLDEFIDESGQPCLVIEYMPGGCLADEA